MLLPARPVVAEPDAGYGMADLTPDQREAAATLTAQTKAGGFSVTLVDGVTGSGKTEVYFEAVAAALAQGRQVLIMLPEIALTQAFLERFGSGFSNPGSPTSDQCHFTC